jgi:hypothetical protein
MTAEMREKAKAMMETVQARVKQAAAAETGGPVPISLGTSHLTSHLVTHGVALNLVPTAVFETEYRKCEQHEKYMKSIGEKLDKCTQTNQQLMSSLKLLTTFKVERFDRTVDTATAASDSILSAARASLVDAPAPFTSAAPPELGAAPPGLQSRQTQVVEFGKDWANLPEDVDALSAEQLKIEEEERRWMARIDEAFPKSRSKK